MTQLAQRFEPGVIRFDKKLPDLAASAGPAHGLRQIGLIREGAQQNLKQGLDLAIRPGVASPVAPRAVSIMMRQRVHGPLARGGLVRRQSLWREGRDA